jgi:ADP/ATP carrier protein family
MFTILINQNIVRSLKDSLVHTLVGTEVISFIKLWGEMPMGVLFVMVYTKLCNKTSTENAFRYIFSFFLVFYLFFACVLYPYKDFFHPNIDTVEYYISSYPHFKWFIIMWGKWSFILIYIMGELWPMIVFSLLFWQLANKITRIEEASRFYPFFSIFGQANLLITGAIVIYFTSKNHFLYSFFDNISDNTEIMIKSNIIIVTISGIIALFIHRHIEKKIIIPNKIEETEKNETMSLGVIDSFKLMVKSPYLRLMAILLISYSFSINLIEAITMYKARQMFETTDLFMAFQGRVLFWTGMVTILCALIGTVVIKKCGWIWGAMATPVIVLAFGIIFFSSILLEDKLSFMEIFFNITPLGIIVTAGALQFIFIKGMKYSMFDVTKEMAYIPLSNEDKTKGKAAVDILGGKIGKSAGSIIQIFIFTVFPFVTYEKIAGLLMFIFIGVCILWIYGVKKLSTQYKKKIN